MSIADYPVILLSFWLHQFWQIYTRKAVTVLVVATAAYALFPSVCDQAAKNGAHAHRKQASGAT